MTVKGTGGLKTINAKTSRLKALKPSYNTAETALRTIHSGYKSNVYQDTALLLSQPNTIIGLVNKALSDSFISNDFFYANLISNRWFSDNNIADDVLNLSLIKGLLDASTAQDALSMSVNKSINDTASFEDTLCVDTYKTLADTSSQEDNMQLSLNKTLSDVSAISEAVQVKLSTFYADIASTVDHFHASLASNRYFEDSISSLDRLSLYPNKVAEDIQSFSDISWFDLLSGKLDIVVAVETFSVSAQKSEHDTSVSLDTLSIHSSKPFEDSNGTSDSTRLDSNKVLDELQAALESIDMSVSKKLADGVDTLDKFSADFTKPDIESLTFVADTFTKSTAFVRNFKDRVTTFDYPDLPGYGYLKDAPKVKDTVEYLIAFIREFNETQQVLDLFAAHFIKPFSDAVGSSDSFSKVILYSRLSTELVSASENLYVDFYKSLHDVALTDEHIAMSVATPMQDLMSTTDNITVTASKVLTETYITKDSIKFDNKTPQSDSVVSSSRADLVLNNYYTSDYSSYSYVGVQTIISN